MNNKDPQLINFCILDEKDVDNLAYPSFNVDTATTRDEEVQWLYYFAKHAEEVIDVLNGEDSRLCVHFLWIHDKMPAFAAAVCLEGVIDDITAGAYISIGNKTLRRLQLEGHEPQKDAHLRFSDSKAVDTIAKEVHEAEITPKKPKKAPKKGRRNNEEDEIIVHTSKIEEAGVLYEEIYSDGKVAFIDGNGLTYERLDVEGIAHEPINGDELKEGAVLLSSDIEDYKNEKTLIEEIKAHIHKYVDVSPFFETISAYYVLLTWLYDEVNTLPYLRALGDTGCGKSRYEDVVGRICYKATVVSGAITPAPIYRLIRKWRGTLIIDEGDFKASDEQNEVVKILNCGFERGRPVVRSQKDNPDNLQFLPTFSPKILSSRKRFKDVALESRCLTEVMKETSREDIPYLLPVEFYEVETSLRNKLLSFRFKNHGSVDIQKAQKLKAIKVEDRLKQAVSSFVVLFANNEKVYEGFVDFLVSYNAELVEERADTIEGAIINAISEISKRTLLSVSHVDVQNDQNVLFTNEDLKKVYITAMDIAEHLKENNGLQDVTSRGVGRRLKTLGITSKKKGTGAERKRYLDLKERSLAKLIKKYIPSSVGEMDVKAVKDVCMGDRGGEIKSYSPVIKGTCEQCGEERFLDHEWEDGEQKHLICSECAEELKNGKESKEEDEVPEVIPGISKNEEKEDSNYRNLEEENTKVREGISKGEDIGYEDMGGGK